MKDYKPRHQWHSDYQPSRRDYVLGVIAALSTLAALMLLTEVPWA